MNFEEIEKLHRRSARLRRADDELSEAVDAVKKAQENLKRASSVYVAELLEMIKKERV